LERRGSLVEASVGAAEGHFWLNRSSDQPDWTSRLQVLIEVPQLAHSFRHQHPVGTAATWGQAAGFRQMATHRFEARLTPKPMSRREPLHAPNVHRTGSLNQGGRALRLASHEKPDRLEVGLSGRKGAYDPTFIENRDAVGYPSASLWLPMNSRFLRLFRL